MRVIIIGAGIGGLTAAVALADAGHDITLLERRPGIDPTGAGIIMAPNATVVLARLGVDLSRYGYALPGLDIVAVDGRPIQRMDTGRLATALGPTWALSRPALHEALSTRLPETVRVLTGHTVTAVDDSDGGVRVALADGRPDLTADLVVGADWLRSTVRDQVSRPRPPRYSGTTCWRGITTNPGHTRAVESWGGATRVGLVPLRDGQLYYYLVRSAPPGAPTLKWPDGFRAVFGAHAVLTHPVGGTDGAGLLDTLDRCPPLHHDLSEVPAPVWGRGRIFLLGDAAHAMTPNQGQGAAMAVEDAYALRQALERGAPGALERYVASRHDRVSAVQRRSRGIGWVAHLRPFPAGRVRDGVLRRIPQSIMDRQYAALVDPALALGERGRAS